MLLRAALLIFLACAPTLTIAQAYPVKPVRMVVPYEPGGAVDLVARDVAPLMSEDLGQPLVVENRGGAGGQIGAQIIAKTSADGYTFMLTVGTTHALSRFATKDLAYDPVKDFTPIAGPVDTILCIASGNALPAASMKDLIEYARRNPGKLSYGTTAAGGSTHLAMEEVARITGVSWVHIPFKGGGPITVNLVGNQLDLAAMPTASLVNHVRSGKVKILAIFGARRFAELPNIPTVSEVVPQYEHLEGGMWALGPAAMPRAVVQRLNGSMNKAVLDPATRTKLEARGQVVMARTTEEFAALFRTANELAAAMVKRSTVKLE